MTFLEKINNKRLWCFYPFRPKEDLFIKEHPTADDFLLLTLRVYQYVAAMRL